MPKRCPRMLFAISLAGCALTGPALAAATAEGARDLQTVLERYAGSPAVDLPQTVSVTPDGEGYKVTIDPSGLLALIPRVRISMPPATFRATPQDGGAWRISDWAPPATMEYSIDDQHWTARTDGIAAEGMFDPALGSWSALSYREDRYASAGTTPNGPVAMEYRDVTQRMTGQGTGRALQTTIDIGAKAFRYALALPKEMGGSGARAEFAADAVTGQLRFDQFANLPLLDIWAFLVAHHTREDIVSRQEELRGLLRSALPLWGAIGETFGLEAFRGVTPAGAFDLGSVKGLLAVSGAVPDGSYGVGLSWVGLHLPDELLQAWSADLLPTSGAFAPTLSGMNFDGAARMLIDRFDLRQNPPLSNENGSAIAKTLFQNPLKLVLKGTRLTSAIYDLSLDGEGSMEIAPGSLPVARATVKMTGLNATIARLGSAPTGSTALGVTVGVLVTARATGRGDPDGEITWDVVLGPDGQMMVNDQPVGPPLK